MKKRLLTVSGILSGPVSASASRDFEREQKRKQVLLLRLAAPQHPPSRM